MKIEPQNPPEFAHARGGHCIFVHPGRGYSRDPNVKPEHGAIIFQTAERDEVMRIEEDGKFVVHGQVVARDEDVFTTFCGWLYSAMREPIVAPSKLPALPTTAPAGTRVVLVEDDYTLTLTETRSEPWPVGNEQREEWVVLVVGRSGGYALERVFPAP
jgi:hypothetical protein